MIGQTVPKIAIFGTVGEAPCPVCNGSSRTIDTMPTTILGTVPPTKPKNADVRPREYLTPKEVELLMKVARKQSRYGHRDATMILLCYRHMLRVSELVMLRWDLIDLDEATLQVRRLKGSKSGVQPLWGSEIRALRRLKREQSPTSPYTFTTERNAPMTAAGFRKILARTGERAKFPWRVHPHMLRHAGGYKFANDSQDLRAIADFAGHKNIQNTLRYTELAANRFRSFWED